MADRRVRVTLTFDTDAPPPAVAMSVGATVASEVPDPLIALTWHSCVPDEEHCDGDAG